LLPLLLVVLVLLVLLLLLLLLLLPCAAATEHLERSTMESFSTGIESAAETWSW
jgi:hypothetical protein